MYKKICVYAISHNEMGHIDQFIESIIDETDYIAILDTGSTDGTWKVLQEFAKEYPDKIIVQQYDYLNKFRFDKARNDSMKLIPIDTDICVTFNLDYVPEAGWSELLRQKFDDGYNEVYGWVVDNSDPNLGTWPIRVAHTNDPYWVWDKMIHEDLIYTKAHHDQILKTATVDDLIIDCYPEPNKDKSIYLDILNYARSIDPGNSFYGYYYCHELYANDKLEEAIQAGEAALNECNFDDNKELAIQINISLGKWYMEKDPEAFHLAAIGHLEEAISMGAYSRRVFNRFADIYEYLEDTDMQLDMLFKALSVESNSKDWTEDDILFKGIIEDKIALIYYYKKNNVLAALEYGAKALQANPDDMRLKENMGYYFSKFLMDNGGEVKYGE